MPNLPTLTLYVRPGCHLCEQAEANLTRLNFTYQPVDVDADPGLRALHGDHVPVLAQGERVLARGVLHPARLGNLKLVLLREAADPKESR